MGRFRPRVPRKTPRVSAHVCTCGARVEKSEAEAHVRSSRRTSVKRYVTRSGKCVQIPPRYEPATGLLQVNQTRFGEKTPLCEGILDLKAP
jgi:hypothetical protein